MFFFVSKNKHERITEGLKAELSLEQARTAFWVKRFKFTERVARESMHERDRLAAELDSAQREIKHLYNRLDIANRTNRDPKTGRFLKLDDA